jgi:hypothetical protein
MLGAETLDLIQLDVGVLRHRHGGTGDPPAGAGQWKAVPHGESDMHPPEHAEQSRNAAGRL